ncbi:MAG: rod shape-determining protein [Proteobacteria bacterium]|nr:MAG: rod shape-determining protein [Pseudomonadota bacterium]
MFKQRLYIDLGTANTLVMHGSRGLVANEPSVVAYIQRDTRRQIVAVGTEAKSKIGRTPGKLMADHPLRDGVVADLDSTQALLRYFIQAASPRFSFTRPSLVISLPYGVSDVEKKAVRDCAISAGASDVTLIEEPMAAAIGADLPVHAARGNMVIDIGGGTTEAAVISLYGIVACEAVRVGGHAFDESIVELLRRRHNLIIGLPTAERVKIAIGSALSGSDEFAPVRGLDFTSGLPREVSISAEEIHQALDPHLLEILSAVKRALQLTPPDLLPDLIKTGAVLAGGGALLKGIRERFERELKIPVRIAEDPLLAIANGGRKTLIDKDLLSKISLPESHRGLSAVTF